MSNTTTSTKSNSQERLDYANKMISDYPNFFPEEHRSFILNGQIKIGMTPFEAKAAGGAFFYRVDADQKKWPVDADPYKVMWAQSNHPDDSKIWMTFKNSTQFPSESEQMFRVYFERGKVVSIEIMEQK